MKNIIKKDISWLVDRVPDFMDFYNNQSFYFTNDGYLAGGFLRKIIKNGSVEKVLENQLGRGDIDFFFYNENAAEKSFESFCKVKGSYAPRLSPVNKNNTAKVTPNSMTGFAFEGTSSITLKDKITFNSVRFQFIAKSTGTPEQVLNRFDISNCKIATDGKNIWMVEDWEKLEEDKIIRVDNLKGEYILTRLKKYLTDDYDLDQSNKDEILIKMLSSVTDFKYLPTIKMLVKHAKFLKPEMIVMFYDKLGTIINIPPEEYGKSSLSDTDHPTEDYALHIYKERVKND
jgi:hypothetical protein